MLMRAESHEAESMIGELRAASGETVSGIQVDFQQTGFVRAIRMLLGFL